jgi:hypothetical protein
MGREIMYKYRIAAGGTSVNLNIGNGSGWNTISGVSGANTQSGFISYGNWQMVTMSYSGNPGNTAGNVFAYSNGAAGNFTYSGTTSTAIGTNRSDIVFGIGLIAGEYFKGTLGSCLVYQSNLTSAQILQNYNATKGLYGL